jgi:class 3 adenylate cyclase/tetratricopeptide (TPR) repeat protein
MKPTRSLVTILFTDIVGSTERVAKLRDAGWRDVRREHDRRVRRELRRFGGHEINTAGDSFLATFTSPARAIACAGAIRSAVRDLGLEIRAGLHMGELESKGHDVGGLGVHIGARVAAEARSGEILVSRSVHDGLAGSSFDFEDRGVRALKGVPGEWRLFAVTSMPEEGSEALPWWSGRMPLRWRHAAIGAATVILIVLAGQYFARNESGSALSTEQALAREAAPGIAVLPFTVQGENLDVWREGMVDLLSTNLDGVAGLRAIDSRTVLARWREGAENQALDLASVLDTARRTGARYALIGEVVGVGKAVRFGADVYDLTDGSKLGRGQVEGSPDSLFALVDRLSIEVLRAIYREGGHALPQMRALESVTTTSLPALKSYLSGETLYRSGDFQAALAEYERAIASDSLFALAIMRVGDAAQWIAGWGSPDEYYERALSLSRLPARETLLARANRDYMRGSSESVDTLRLAVQRYPDDPDFWHLLGESYYHLGQRITTEAEADRVFSRALTLDPYFAHYYLHPMDIALHKGDSVRTATLLQAYVRIAPKEEETVWQHTVAFSLAFGDSAQRLGALEALDTLPIIPATGLVTILSHPRFGRIQEQSYRRILARPDEPPDAIYYFLFINLLERGRFRESLEYLEQVPGSDRDYSAQSFMAYLLVESGVPLPRDVVERYLSVEGSADERNALSAGVFSADEGRWSEHDSAVRMLSERADQLYVSGDSAGYDFVADEAKAVQAYGQWKRGHGREAVPILQGIKNLGFLPNWWLGKLSLELGMLREAEMYFSSIWGDPAPLKALAAFYLGGIYNDLGEFEKSRQAYEYALLAWVDADPEMQARIDAARQALARLPKPLRRERP